MNRNTSPTWPKIALSVLCVVLALVLIAMIFVTVYVQSLLNQISRPNTESQQTLSSSEKENLKNTIYSEETDPDFSGPSLDPSEVTLSTVAPSESESIVHSDDLINILLIGQDRRPGEGRQRSDSMILCSFNTKTNTLTMTSFLRDLYVSIPGHHDDRLNATYVWGGMPLLDETLAVNFGVQVDANVEVDFDGFMAIIDLLGGVDINLTQREADYLSGRLPNVKSHAWQIDAKLWNLSPGLNHLTSEQALVYCRTRYLDGDAYRANRQRTVISAIIKEYKNQDLGTMLSLLNQILPNITTDMTNAEIINYAKELFPLLSSCSIQTQQIPATGTYQSATIRGMQVKVPDLVANREILKNLLGGN